MTEPLEEPEPLFTRQDLMNFFRKNVVPLLIRIYLIEQIFYLVKEIIFYNLGSYSLSKQFERRRESGPFSTSAHAGNTGEVEAEEYYEDEY